MLSTPQPWRCCTNRVWVRPDVQRSGEASVREAISAGDRVAWYDERARVCSTVCPRPPRASSMDASMVESRRREFVDSRVHRDRPRSCSYRNRDVPRPGMESISVEPELRQHGGAGDNCGVSPRTRSPGREAQSNCRAGAYLRSGIQWIGVAGHVDREPSKSPRESRYDRG